MTVETELPEQSAAPALQPLLNTAALEAVLARFAAERDWQPFLNARSLMLALVGEVGELAELFQWRTEAQADALANGSDPVMQRAVEDEIADVMLYLVQLAMVLKVDLNIALIQKIAANAQKYPPIAPSVTPSV